MKSLSHLEAFVELRRSHEGGEKARKTGSKRVPPEKRSLCVARRIAPEATGANGVEKDNEDKRRRRTLGQR
jgi:hypothetical protein